MRLLFLVIVLLCGCQRSASPKVRFGVPLDQVPPVVLKAAQEKLPNIKFDSANKLADGAYEVRGKAKNGKIHDVRVSEAGEVLEVD